MSDGVVRLNPIDDELRLALLNAIKDEDWALEKGSRFKKRIKAIYLLKPETGDYYDVWPHLVKPTMDLVEKAVPKDWNQTLSKLVIAKMPAHTSINPHIDSWVDRKCRRVHVPLSTNEKAIATIGGIDYHMGIGWSWEFDLFTKHNVANDSDEDRIHLLIDVRINDE